MRALDPIALRVAAESVGITPIRGHVNRDTLWQTVADGYDRLTRPAVTITPTGTPHTGLCRMNCKMGHRTTCGCWCHP